MSTVNVMDEQMMNLTTGPAADGAAAGFGSKRSPLGVYLAGPSGFTEPGLLWHNEVLVPLVTAAGLVAKDPWADQSAIHDVLTSMEFGLERRDRLREANLVQGRHDLQLIRESSAILAVLDGSDVDSGTALEIGYGFALGVVIVGLRTDIRGSGDNEGSEVNLMIETCIADSGGLYTTDVREAVSWLAARLGAGGIGSADGMAPGD